LSKSFSFSLLCAKMGTILTSGAVRMKFAKRMERFNTGIFSVMADLKQKEIAQGKKVVDLSVGTPNIPPAPHIINALAESARDPKNYVYALSDTAELQEAVQAWYQRRYGVEIDPSTEMTSLLGSQDGLSHISLTVVDRGNVVLVPDPGYPIFADGPALAGAELYYMPQTMGKRLPHRPEGHPGRRGAESEIHGRFLSEQPGDQHCAGIVLPRADRLCKKIRHYRSARQCLQRACVRR
jgi:hypothetical protein